MCWIKIVIILLIRYTIKQWTRCIMLHDTNICIIKHEFLKTPKHAINSNNGLIITQIIINVDKNGDNTNNSGCLFKCIFRWG